MLRFMVLVLVLLASSTLAWAHGTGQHVLGTVTAIDGKHIEVKTPKGAIVSVILTKQTRYKEKGNPKSAEPPVIGDRVVIEATKDAKDSKVLTATEVHYSASRKAAPSPAPATAPAPVPVP